MDIESGEKCGLLIDSKLLDSEDVKGLERLLKEHVDLAPKGVSIYIQISAKTLRQRAKAAQISETAGR